MLAVALLLAGLQDPASQGGFRDSAVRVLHDWRGLAAGEQFGWVARNAGDVDGDGADDVIASAPFHLEGGAQAGRVEVRSGRSGALLFEKRGAGARQLGFTVCGLGDLDGDGHGEFAAGAPLAGGGAGAALLWSGADGSLLREIAGSEPGARLGSSLCGVADLDGDAVPDLAVAAPAAGPGVVFLYSGASGAELGVLEGERDGDAFGTALGSGDWIGSRLLVVGAKDAGEGRRGRAYVYEVAALQPRLRFAIDALPSGVDLGRFFVSVLGDVDGDGEADVYAADFSDVASAAGAQRPGGRFYVHSGASGARLAAPGAFAPGEGLGIGDARAGDQDGDGRADLIVGAWTHGDAGAGAVYLISGADFSVLARLESGVAGEAMGFDATGLGDLDGDGRREFLLTGAYHASRGPQTGRAVVLSSRGR